ncbi:hypothetical protein CKO35_09725 [Ectothiorhodospira shaposhnikovii]|uniref:response regulator n=1 Tax=Ectothiorhodospira shaposhnikovii TaxID=1054 RepID=UPI001F5BC078|nr:response regulator [Ectothiorhodospira shaposhnikovii]MBK1673580.1 hypothetical protein [Ectothiorhodospira shaposhnikovii]
MLVQEDKHCTMLTSQDSSAVAAKAPLRVLVVDDEIGIRQEVISDLQRRGIDSLSADSPDEALSLFSSGVDPDCMLIDLMMPKRDGFLLIDDIRRFCQERQRVPPAMIAMTGEVSQDFIRRIFRKKVDDFLLKPVTMADLREAILRAAALTRLRRRLFDERLGAQIDSSSGQISSGEAKELLATLVPAGNLEEICNAICEEGVLPPVTI